MKNKIRTTEKDNQLKKIIGKDGFNQLIKSVTNIEDGIPTTRNHYGKYMGILSPFSNKNEIAMLLIYLGANKEGVIDALKITGAN